ncbi:MAG: metallophosphoesterase [Proteobacteria bacterium]|nr:metallophosphoesterase [Pseudomonadota bacterium]
MDTDEGTALSGNTLRFAHLSDLHLPHEPRLRLCEHFSKRQLSVWSWRRRRAVQSPVVLEALLADMSTHRPDRILVTGDLTNFSLPAEFTAAAAWLGRMPVPASVVPGNHDRLVPVPEAEGWGKLAKWSTAGEWPLRSSPWPGFSHWPELGAAHGAAAGQWSPGKRAVRAPGQGAGAGARGSAAGNPDAASSPGRRRSERPQGAARPPRTACRAA